MVCFGIDFKNNAVVPTTVSVFGVVVEGNSVVVVNSTVSVQVVKDVRRTATSAAVIDVEEDQNIKIKDV